jgi:hypothetical protein
MGGSKATVDHPAQARHVAGDVADYLSTMSPAGSPAETIDRVVGAVEGLQVRPITVIIGGRALLMLIAARFSGSGSGKDLLSRAISLIASGLLPFSSFPIPVAPNSYRGRDRPACRIPCARRGMAHRVQPQ